MTYFKSVGTATAIATLMSTTAVYADFTPETAWDAFVSMAETQGATVTAGATTTTGTTLTATDVVMNFDTMIEAGDDVAAEDIPTVNYTSPSVVFTDNGDGTVAMTFPDDSTFTISFPDAAELERLSLTVSTPDQVSTFSGEPADYTVATIADTMTATLDPITVDSITLDTKTAIVIEGLDTTTSYKIGDLIEQTAEWTLASIKATSDFTIPGDEGSFKLDAQFNDITSTGAGTLVSGISAQDTVAQLSGGMTAKGDATVGVSAVNFFVDTPDGVLDFVATTGLSTMDFVMDKDAFLISGTSSDIVRTFTVPGMPLPPLTIAATGGEFGLAAPLSNTEAGDFALVTKFAGLTIDDTLWGMFDPQAILPRDAIDITVDTSGSFKWLVDLFADDVEEQFLNAEMPVELNSFQLNELLVSAVGAKATGSGAVEFDLTDTVTYDGLPAPVGKFSFSLEGANGVLDKIVEMGFLTAEDAMGARMMSGMFMKAGEGDDVLLSDIELTDEKQILVNGVRVK